MLVVGLGKVFQVGGVGATSTSVVVGVGGKAEYVECMMYVELWTLDVNLKFKKKRAEANSGRVTWIRKRI